MESIKDFWDTYEFDPSQSLDQKGFGSVYKGKDKRTDDVVVVKSTEMHPNFDDGWIWRKYDEAIALQHKNLLPYIAAYRFEGEGMVSNFGVMPYVERLSLNLLDPNDLTDEEKVDWINQVLDGLHYMHEQGHVWQKLSATHILMEKSAEDYVLKFINYGNKQPIPLVFFSNYEYLAPEQFGDPTVLDKRTDIWSLGVLIYWLYTGQLPFGRKTTRHPNTKIEERILNRPIPDLIDLIPKPYKTIVQKCLKKNIAERWADCGQIIGAIEKQSIANSTKDTVAEQEIELSAKTIDNEPDRRYLRKPSKPIIWWQVLLLFGLAAAFGYWLSQKF
ncbi:MAG: protein kinase [Aureispira sp.]|nr:protein kinase [Aureispira sp.]